MNISHHQFLIRTHNNNNSNSNKRKINCKINNNAFNYGCSNFYFYERYARNEDMRMNPSIYQYARAHNRIEYMSCMRAYEPIYA
jgi:hypothetical protein